MSNISALDSSFIKQPYLFFKLLKNYVRHMGCKDLRPFRFFCLQCHLLQGFIY